MKMLLLLVAAMATPLEAATVRGLALRDLAGSAESQSLLLSTTASAPEVAEIPSMTADAPAESIEAATASSLAEVPTLTEAEPAVADAAAEQPTEGDAMVQAAAQADSAVPVEDQPQVVTEDQQQEVAEAAVDGTNTEVSPEAAAAEIADVTADRPQVSSEALINIGAVSALPQDTSAWSADRSSAFGSLKTGFFAILTLITACILFDGLAYLLHKTQFQACKQQIQRVGDMFQHSKTNLQLCPYCVEDLTGCSSDKVTFLCGHRFHTKCANEGFRLDPVTSGRCPVCFGSKADGKANGCEGHVASEDLGKDQAQTYVLKSLHRLYPKIIPEDCVKRWTPCHTEIWLSELTCPRYNSIFKVFRSEGRV